MDDTFIIFIHTLTKTIELGNNTKAENTWSTWQWHTDI